MVGSSVGARRLVSSRSEDATTTDVLGVPVSLTNLSHAVATIANWCKHREANFVCVRDVHGIMRAQDDERLRLIHHRAGMVTPDGMPLVWISRRRGHREVGRVCGADLVAALCDASQDLGLRHYLYGGKPGVAERMRDELLRRYPRLTIVGCDSPPFRRLSKNEDEQAVARLNEARPHIVWVGLSTPKQEYWMADHVGRIAGATLIGVGAAFDFYSGDVKRAPRWMQRNGLEWLHRLASEPRRLWRRYLVMAPSFVLRAAVQEFRRAPSP
jgi:N-acetylglucosaminyldiphosphoundecaprenol N-acetyl-beta-D-mannosaminyltransferase